MGQTLSSPATYKYTNTGEDERYIYVVSEMQGWRISMEDAHAVVLDLDEGGSSDKNAFFAVYDGHGGETVARFAGHNVHRRLTTDESYHAKRYDVALKKAFLGTDEDLRADPSFFHDPSGCTAIAALLTSDRKLYVANAGDSRSIISVKGEAKPLSYDHKPQNEAESARIAAAGGYVEYGRVNGNLALSRAIGDFEFKKNWALSPERQIITADPDITIHDLTDEDEFLVLACDGIWDCLSSQQVVDSIRRMIHDGIELTKVCEILMDLCLSPSSRTVIGCDNMTIVVVALLNGRTKEEWYAWVKDRVARQYGYDTPLRLPRIFPHTVDEDEHDGAGLAGSTGPLGFLLAKLEEERAGMNRGDRGLGRGSHLLEQDGDDMSDPDEDDAADWSPVHRHFGKLEDKDLLDDEPPLPPLDAKLTKEQPQLVPLPPSGDAPSGAVKVEGLMDTSESPFKTD